MVKEKCPHCENGKVVVVDNHHGHYGGEIPCSSCRGTGEQEMEQKKAWTKVMGLTLDITKKYAVRVNDGEDWKDEWVIIAWNEERKDWVPLCCCDGNEFNLMFVTHYIELPECAE